VCLLFKFPTKTTRTNKQTESVNNTQTKR